MIGMTSRSSHCTDGQELGELRLNKSVFYPRWVLTCCANVRRYGSHVATTGNHKEEEWCWERNHGAEDREGLKQRQWRSIVNKCKRVDGDPFKSVFLDKFDKCKPLK